MKKAPLFLFCFLFVYSSFSQSPSFSWVRDFGGTDEDLSLSIEVGPDSNVYMTGFYKSLVDFNPGAGSDDHMSAGGKDIFISKFDPDGNQIWTKTFGSAYLYDQGSSLAIGSDTTIYLAGAFGQTVDFDPGPGTYNLTAAGEDGFICKLTQDGELIWVKQFSGSSTDECRHIKLDDANNIYCSGNFQNTVDFNPGAGTFNLTSVAFIDMFLLKLDSDGNFLWVDQFGGPNVQSERQLYVSGDGEITLSGCFNNTMDADPGPGTVSYSPLGDTDSFLAVIDTDGNLVWAHRYWGGDQFQGHAVTRDAANNILFSGYWTGTADFDDGSGDYIVTAPGGFGGFCSFVLKMDENGEFISAGTFGGSVLTFVDDIESYQSQIYIVGQYAFNADFDPGPGIYEMTSEAIFERFLLILDSDLNFKYAFQFGGSDDGGPGGDLTFTSTGDFYTTSYFEGSEDLNPTSGVFNGNASGVEDIFLVKMRSCIETVLTQSTEGITLTAPAGLESYQWYNCGKEEIVVGETGNVFTATENGSYAVIINNGFCTDTSECTSINSVGVSSVESDYFNVYPNPVSDQLVIECPMGSVVSIYNSMGQLVFSETMVQSKNHVSFNEKSAGIYTCEFRLNGQTTYTKIVKLDL